MMLVQEHLHDALRGLAVPERRDLAGAVIAFQAFLKIRSQRFDAS
jgi:hypothetical protein